MESMVDYGIIYKVTNIINGKVYIGQCKGSLKSRKKRHERTARNQENRLFPDTLRKYGFDNFNWEIIDVSKSEEDSYIKEKLYISKYKSNIRKYGYNMTSGGKQADYMANHPNKEDICKKISEKLKGIKISEETRKKRELNYKNNPNYGMTGKHHSNETKEKIKHTFFTSSQVRGKNNCKAIKVTVISPTGEKFFLHGEYTKFCKKNRLKPQLLMQTANGTRKFYRGWRCIRED